IQGPRVGLRCHESRAQRSLETRNGAAVYRHQVVVGGRRQLNEGGGKHGSEAEQEAPSAVRMARSRSPAGASLGFASRISFAAMSAAGILQDPSGQATDAADAYDNGCSGHRNLDWLPQANVTSPSAPRSAPPALLR